MTVTVRRVCGPPGRAAAHELQREKNKKTFASGCCEAGPSLGETARACAYTSPTSVPGPTSTARACALDSPPARPGSRRAGGLGGEVSGAGAAAAGDRISVSGPLRIRIARAGEHRPGLVSVTGARSYAPGVAPSLQKDHPHLACGFRRLPCAFAKSGAPSASLHAAVLLRCDTRSSSRTRRLATHTRAWPDERHPRTCSGALTEGTCAWGVQDSTRKE